MSNSDWYARMFVVLNPLRYHLLELLEAVESHNRAARMLGEPVVSEEKVAVARAALDGVESEIATFNNP